MAKVRNVSNDALITPYGDVEPGKTVDVPDADIWPADLPADDVKGLKYAQANPNARNWRVPGVWEVTTDPPAVAPKPADAEPTPAA